MHSLVSQVYFKYGKDDPVCDPVKYETQMVLQSFADLGFMCAY